jgi:translocation and assembly module TamB
MATVTTTTTQKARRGYGVWLARMTAKTILYIILFLLIILLFVQLPFVQNIIRKKVVAYLENKLDTRIEVGSLHVGWPQDIVLKDVYIEDKQKDTLLSGGSIEARLDLWDLAFNNEINISNIELNNITAKIKRQLPDTTFNFQFIVDAFVPTDASTASPADTSASAITLRSLELNNVRIVYQDIVSGTDMQASVQYFDTKIDVFNPEQLKFDVPETTIKGLTASLYQVKPLARPTPAAIDSMEAEQPIVMDLDFRNVNLENVNVVYRNDVSATSGSFVIGELEVTPENIDLNNRFIELKDLTAKNTNTIIRIGKDPEGKVLVKEVEQEAASQVEAGWNIRVESIDMQNNKLQFDNDNMPRKPAEMDYAHLKADSFSLQAKNIVQSAAPLSRPVSASKAGLISAACKPLFYIAAKRLTCRIFTWKHPAPN